MIKVERNGKGSTVVEVGFSQAAISLKNYTDSYDDGTGKFNPVIIDDSIEIEFYNNENLKYLLSQLLEHFGLISMSLDSYRALTKSDLNYFERQKCYNIIDELIKKNA